LNYAALWSHGPHINGLPPLSYWPPPTHMMSSPPTRDHRCRDPVALPTCHRPGSPPLHPCLHMAVDRAPWSLLPTTAHLYKRGHSVVAIAFPPPHVFFHQNFSQCRLHPSLNSPSTTGRWGTAALTGSWPKCRYPRPSSVSIALQPFLVDFLLASTPYLSVPYRPGTPTHKLEIKTRSRVCTHMPPP
jgi:hypothetical protein